MPKNNPTSFFHLLPVFAAILFAPTPSNNPRNATAAVSSLPAEVVPTIPSFASVSPSISTPIATVVEVRAVQVAQIPDTAVLPTLETIALPSPGLEVINGTISIEDDHTHVLSIEINARQSVLDIVLEHLSEYRVAYAIGVPLFFLPTLWTLFCIWCLVKRSAPYIIYYLVKEAIKGLQDCPPFVAAVFLLHSILPPSRTAAEYMEQRKCFQFGIEIGAEYIVCVLTAGLWLDERYFGSSNRCFIWVVACFWGLAGFLKGCGWTSDYRPSYSAIYQATGRDQDLLHEEGPSTGSVTFQGSISEEDMQEHEISDDEYRTKTFYTRLAAHNSIGRNSKQGLKNSSPRAQIRPADYDADAETDDDSMDGESTRDPIIPSPKPTTREILIAKGPVPASIKGGQRRGAARPVVASPVKDKKDRPRIHPSVRDIIGPALYEKLEKRSTDRAATSSSLPSDPLFTSDPAPSQLSDAVAPPGPDYLLPPARTPKHSRYTSTPRVEVETGPAGSTPSVLDIPDMPEVESLLPIGDDLLHPPISPAVSLLSIPLSAANSVADELDATFDLSREWEPYGGENQFVFSVQAKAAASEVVDASTMKGGHKVKLTLGGGTFENEDGVATCTRLPLGRPPSALLDKIDARLAQIGVSTLASNRHSAGPFLRGIQRMKDFRWPNKPSSLVDVAEE